MKRMILSALMLSLLNGLAGPAPARSAPARFNTLPVQVQDYLSQHLPGYRLATSRDYEAAITGEDQGLPFVSADFDQDGQTDWALLLIHDQTWEARVYYLLGRKDGFKPELLLSRKALDTGIQTPLFFKPAGAEGLTAFDYNELQAIPNWQQLPHSDYLRQRRQKAAHYVSVPAIMVWTGTGQKLAQPELSDLAYCQRSWFYQAGVLKAFNACD